MVSGPSAPWRNWHGGQAPIAAPMRSLNGSWTADPEPNKPGRDLGYARYGKMAEALGCHTAYV